ncbi:MAG: UDP-N-acetylglucosamine 1-carboxyvinyltransferase [Lentisphaeria bacterium]|nr:UDP-N-acetylglucosamine 1-carboxyvinyltransferase [Lentisphaerota bacterium]MBO5644813.1 UDP-N-acetylglucosamine 1-carboxyvinyltransferase [Lentisphaeria bacterium]
MESLRITGQRPISGDVTISGNKNAVLPMIPALLLTDEECVLHNVPDIRDVRSMLEIAGVLGAEFTFEKNTLRFKCSKVRETTIPRELCAKNRTSILFAAPLICRCGKAELYPPGGDVIGRRRLDGHFYGLTKLGAEMSGDLTYIFNAPSRLAGRELFLDESSVTATEQILLAAATAEGVTTLYNAACEPHVNDLANLLNEMGAKISGIGSNTLTIEGVEKLHGAEHTVIGDHIEAGSFLALAAATGGSITVHGTNNRNHWMLRRVFERLGVKIELLGDRIFLPGGQTPEIQCDYGGHIPQISDGPWPHFPSDMMSCTIVAATQCKGTVMFFEKMFESRIYFADRLISMGANAIVCDPHRVVITGKANLHAQEMSSPDIRAGMAMVIAALCAKGTSTINHAEIIYRGYEDLISKLRGIGAEVEDIRI